MKNGEIFTSHFRFRESAEAGVVKRISSFCSAESLPHRLDFLDQELSVYGYPSIQTDEKLNQVALVNVTYDLLQTYRRALESHSDTADGLRNSESDAARFQHLLSLAREDVATKDRELKTKRIEEAHLNQRIETLRKKLKSEQEKCRRLSSEMQSRDTQFKHEKKKKSQEVERMQTKLHQLLQDKKHERLLGIEILNSLQRSDGKRGKWTTDKTKKNNEQEMYQLILANYEDSQKELLNENTAMRKYLKQMQDELVCALNEKATQRDMKQRESRRLSLDKIDIKSSASVSSEESEASDSVLDGMFEMPYDIVKDDIEKSLKSKWRALRRLYQHKNLHHLTEEDKGKAENKSEKITEYEKVIQEQQDLIDYFTAGQGEKSSSFPSDAYFLEEKSDLDQQKSIFYQQRLAFENERKVYTEALLQLGQDQQNFEEEKSRWLQHHFLQLTPFRGSSSKKKWSSPNKSFRDKSLSLSWNEGLKNHSAHDVSPSLRNARGQADGMGTSGGSSGAQPLLTRSPNKTSPSRSPETPHNPWNGASPPIPSTCELYRALGLRYKSSDKENNSSTSSFKVKSCLKKSPTNQSHASPDGQSELFSPRDSGHTLLLRHNRLKMDDIKTALFQI
ncbi:afadin- and alpha-actinin-binding protein B-like isoform X2 [Clavelina lepadiformis]|uniref:afadin- and alpha-actinin-binding protein B-like isoform X2 n=1 Tax=Clavelina lepadiformis TaxID=159417 RepID=UPI0040429875